MSKELIIAPSEHVNVAVSKLPELAEVMKLNWSAANRINAKVIEFSEFIPEITNQEQDKDANDLLALIDKAYAAVKSREDSYLPYLTLLVKEIKRPRQMLEKTHESYLGTNIVKARDIWAKKEIARVKEEQRVEQIRLAKIDEALKLKESIANALSTHFYRHLAKIKNATTEVFNSMTLETVDGKYASLMAKIWKYDIDNFNEFNILFPANYHTTSDQERFLREAKEGKYEIFNDLFVSELSELTAELLAHFPSKKAELLAFQELEIERQKEIEIERQTANAARQKELELQQAENRRIAAENEAKKKTLEAERIARENEAKAAIEAKAKADQEAAAKIAANNKAVAAVNNLFDATNQQASITAPAAKVKLKLKITHPAGAVYAFNEWYEGIGKLLTPEDLEDKLSFVFTYLNKCLNSDKNFKIDVNSLEIVEEIKSTVQKEKKK